MIGVPIRIGIGARDLAEGKIEVARRDTKEKISIGVDDAEKHIIKLLEDIQNDMFSRAKKFRDEHITRVDDFKTFEEVLDTKTGFISAHWDGTTETEEKIKELTKATIRCIPLDAKEEKGLCILTGKPSNKRVLFARAY